MRRSITFAIAIVALIAGIVMTTTLLYLGNQQHLPHVSLPVAAAISGLFAMLIGWRLLPAWWRPVLLIAPLATVLSFTINPWWFFGLSVVLIALQWNAIFTRIPLYRSDRIVGESLSRYMILHQYQSLLDIGCGDGRLVMHLAKLHPERQFVGIESAPVLYLVARWRCRNLSNCEIRFGDFWKISWTPFDVVFAFLSPEPMLWVWRKAERDMRRESALLSLAFTVPGIEEDEILPAHQFDLFVYAHRTHRSVDAENAKQDAKVSALSSI